jgi:hypothetical protein
MYLSSKSSPTAPSNFHFAIFVSTFLFFVSILFFFNQKLSLSIMLVLLSFLFLSLAFLNPNSLNNLNKIWFKIGIMLGRITNPIILGLIFLVVITPVAIISKIFGRDELKLKNRNIYSNWIEINDITTNTNYFKNQF